MMDETRRQRKSLHLKDFDYKGSAFVYFITLCTAGKRPFFLHGDLAEMVVEELDYRRIAGEINLYCYCVMPDHLHLLLSLAEGYGRDLKNWVSAFKRYISRAANEEFGIKPLWQKNFHERVIRKKESLPETAEYILNNPVRKGIVQEWTLYPHCKMVDDLPMR
jgi:REP element-mobilizing transposase RayT